MYFVIMTHKYSCCTAFLSNIDYLRSTYTTIETPAQYQLQLYR